MHPLSFVAPLLLLLPAYAAVAWGGAWSFALPLIAFGLIPLLDQLSPGSTRNATVDEEHERLADPRFDALLAAVVPLHLGLIVAFLLGAAQGRWAGAELLGVVLSVGIAQGAFGINVAHEMGHRRERRWQLGAKVLLGSTHYLHFFVEHNRGHHRRVATPEDPASARRGETVYAFWLRSVVGSFASAWGLERDRLAAADSGPWTWRNEVLRGAVIQVALLAVVAVTLGPVAAALWLAASLVGILLLETVNYVEHYGLSRARKAHGAYERVQPHHSWNSNRPAGRVFLFELTRHADHHAHATRPFAILRHHDAAPELPAGYPAMILLSLAPPLFFAVMDRLLDGRADAAPLAT